MATNAGDPGRTIIEEESPASVDACVQVACQGSLVPVPDMQDVDLAMQTRGPTARDGMTPQELIAFGKLKWFCNALVKKLAPPVLLEVQSTLRPEAGPFTPRRATRSTKRAPASRNKATQAENVLMRAVAIVPEDLEGNDDHIAELAELFESPLREQHIRVIAEMFGKEVPPVQDMSSGTTVVVGAS